MDTILFIGMFCCLILVAGWYVGNELRRTKGAWGLLAVGSRENEARQGQRPKYRMKADPAAVLRSSGARQAASDEGEPKLFHTAKTGARFQNKDEAGYRTRGPLPRYGERPKR